MVLMERFDVTLIDPSGREYLIPDCSLDTMEARVLAEMQRLGLAPDSCATALSPTVSRETQP